MNTNGVHCQVSPMITAMRAAHGSVTHVQLRSPSATQIGSSGPFDGVGHHPEHVADADRRDRQRDQEHDPEEAPPRQRLDGEDRQPETEQELERDPGEDEDERDDQRARPAAVAGSVPTTSHRRPTKQDAGR